MKITNTLPEFTDQELRKMVAWVCREIELPVRHVRTINFRRARGAWSGRYYHGAQDISVRVGIACNFPTESSTRFGRTPIMVRDQWDCVVKTTAHELTHLQQDSRGVLFDLKCQGSLERITDSATARVLKKFQADRDELLPKWKASPPKARESKPKPTAAERREAQARASLDRWERKLKAAQKKVASYRRKVKYYDRKQSTLIAASNAPQDKH